MPSHQWLCMHLFIGVNAWRHDTHADFIGHSFEKFQQMDNTLCECLSKGFSDCLQTVVNLKATIMLEKWPMMRPFEWMMLIIIDICIECHNKMDGIKETHHVHNWMNAFDIITARCKFTIFKWTNTFTHEISISIFIISINLNISHAKAFQGISNETDWNPCAIIMTKQL